MAASVSLWPGIFLNQDSQDLKLYAPGMKRSAGVSVDSATNTE